MTDARTLADEILKAAGSALRHYEAASQDRIIAVAQRWIDEIVPAWSSDIEAAPRGRMVAIEQMRCTSDGKVSVVREHFVPDWIWAACDDGKVYKTHFLPPEPNHRPDGRWMYLGSKQQPIAWMPFVTPAYPGTVEVAA